MSAQRSSCDGACSDWPTAFEYSADHLIAATNGWEEPLPKYSAFDEALTRAWNAAMVNGLFRYDLTHVLTRILPGSMKFVAQLNMKRATDRRRPDEMLSLNQPFDASKFNFTKLPVQEILFELRLQQHHSASSTAADGAAQWPRPSETGAAEQRQSAAEEKPSSGGSSKSRPRHLVAINVSPLEFGHVLLIPDVDACLNQNLTLSGIGLALDMMLLSAHRGFRVGFNSLCAYASVNHQHLHGYYLDYELYVETAAAKKLCPGFYEMLSTPTTGFGFQLQAWSRTKLARMIFYATNYLREREVAHCLFITRGRSFDESDDKNVGLGTTVRVILWPRQSVIGAKRADAAFNSAVVELAGHLLIKDVALYESMDEEHATTILREASLCDQDFDSIRQYLVDAYSHATFG